MNWPICLFFRNTSFSRQVIFSSDLFASCCYQISDEEVFKCWISIFKWLLSLNEQVKPLKNVCINFTGQTNIKRPLNIFVICIKNFVTRATETSGRRSNYVSIFLGFLFACERNLKREKETSESLNCCYLKAVILEIVCHFYCDIMEWFTALKYG